MQKIKIAEEDRKPIIDKIRKYCAQHFELELGQFDATFFLDFFEEVAGPTIYNLGIDEAIKTYASFSERIQEEIDLKRIF